MTRGEKGSQLRMRSWVNDAREDLNAHLIGWSSLSDFQDGEPRWLSPLQPDYTEIRDGLWRKAQLPGRSPQRERWWPDRGPQWDGVAAVRGPKHEPGVLLVEAKSHPAEVLSTASAKHHESKAMIMRALAETKRYLGVDERQDWTSPYYQMANRLAFLYFLRERQKIPAWLVFLYFVGDQFWSRNRLIVGPTTPDEWEPHISAAYDGLGLKRANPLSPFVLHTFLPAVCKTANS